MGGGVGALRKNSVETLDIGSVVQKLDQRLLQAYTNETTGYEDGAAVNQDREVDFETCYGAAEDIQLPHPVVYLEK